MIMAAQDMKNISAEILELKKSTGAIIFAHNYVAAEIQDIADFVGDSLELSLKAAQCKEKIILFCGVSFMAETAKVLSPESMVLLPVPDAGCPMADMAPAEEVKKLRAENPDAVFIAYVNTTAGAKANVDICCTSANAEKIAASVPADRKIIFLPDKNLGRNVAKSVERKYDFWNGCCPIHDKITCEMIMQAKKEHPGCPVIIHPECRPEVVACADYSASTGKMLSIIKEDPASGFVIATEEGILHRLKKEFPERNFYALSPCVICADMKKITLESVRDALKFKQHEVLLDAETIKKARVPIERMLNTK